MLGFTSLAFCLQSVHEKRMGEGEMDRFPEIDCPNASVHQSQTALSILGGL